MLLLLKWGSQSQSQGAPFRMAPTSLVSNIKPLFALLPLMTV